MTTLTFPMAESDIVVGLLIVIFILAAFAFYAMGRLDGERAARASTKPPQKNTTNPEAPAEPGKI